MTDSPLTSQIPNLPQSLHYYPAFLPQPTSSTLLQKILQTPKPKWTHLSHRRLQSYPTSLTATTNTLITPPSSSPPLPEWLTEPMIPRMQELNIWAGAPHGAPNHVLVNEYLPGRGILPHEDGGAYWPVVGTVSLGGVIVLDVYEKRMGGGKGRRVGRVLLEDGSLLVTTGDMYTSYLHGIAEVTVDEDLGPETIANWELLGDKDRFKGGRSERGARISLTYRDVLKVVKVGGGFLRK
ncbi:unnamed protein product [Tuber melanosporum]|uniref:(Perigord truffle) hypothetical protein n=1 Tax=Tuber melanosporum (strain Mel28) TaxID=656061 RepID=D5G9G9_TUBMM|nr:uncharacterized protein GSTUM_00003396001 [Tuber melanosporum]CAZ81162.1 unnamed protein product [Tuber melanosporum]